MRTLAIWGVSYVRDLQVQLTNAAGESIADIKGLNLETLGDWIKVNREMFEKVVFGADTPFMKVMIQRELDKVGVNY